MSAKLAVLARLCGSDLNASSRERPKLAQNEVICVNLTKINNYFMNYKFIKSLFIIVYFMVIMQTHR